MIRQGSKPRIAIGALMHESNAFAPPPMELADFRKNYYQVGPAVVEKPRGGRVEIAGTIDVLEREGVEIVLTNTYLPSTGSPRKSVGISAGAGRGRRRGRA